MTFLINNWHFLKVFVHSTSECDGDTSCEDFSLSFDQSQSVDHTSTSETNYTLKIQNGNGNTRRGSETVNKVKNLFLSPWGKPYLKPWSELLSDLTSSSLTYMSVSQSLFVFVWGETVTFPVKLNIWLDPSLLALAQWF